MGNLTMALLVLGGTWTIGGPSVDHIHDVGTMVDPPTMVRVLQTVRLPDGTIEKRIVERKKDTFVAFRKPLPKKVQPIVRLPQWCPIGTA